MKLCRDCIFFKSDLIDLCTRQAQKLPPEPVRGHVHTRGYEHCFVERTGGFFSSRCGAKGRHHTPKTPQ